MRLLVALALAALALATAARRGHGRVGTAAAAIERVSSGRDAQRYGIRTYDIRGIDAPDSELRLVGGGDATLGWVRLQRTRVGFRATITGGDRAPRLTLECDGEAWSIADGSGAPIAVNTAAADASAAFALLVAVLADEAVQGKFPIVSRGEPAYVSCGAVCGTCTACVGAFAPFRANACEACAPCFACVEAAR